MQPYTTVVNSFGHQFLLYNNLTAGYTFSCFESDSLMSEYLHALSNPFCILQMHIKKIFWHNSEEQHEITFIVGLSLISSALRVSTSELYLRQSIDYVQCSLFHHTGLLGYFNRPLFKCAYPSKRPYKFLNQNICCGYSKEPSQ